MSEFATKFDPKTDRLLPGTELESRPDARDGGVYVWDRDIVLTVQVAMATGRPLLISGPPGCGKSSLAAFVARSMGWNYLEQVITSRSRSEDLQWRFDAVRRLRDAHVDKLDDRPQAYLEPQVLWWGIDPLSASRRGLSEEQARDLADPAAPGLLRGTDRPSVVLLDEIDKADPDVPNDLLVALGSLQFQVTDTSTPVELPPGAIPPLVLITSNNERALPRAFLRRCVTLKLKLPDDPELFVRIAKAHFGADDKAHNGLYLDIAKRTVALQDSKEREQGEPPPGTAEYLDAVRACLELKIKPGSKSSRWQTLERVVLRKAHDL